MTLQYVAPHDVCVRTVLRAENRESKNVLATQSYQQQWKMETGQRHTGRRKRLLGQQGASNRRSQIITQIIIQSYPRGLKGPSGAA